jgi:hypothetical protein
LKLRDTPGSRPEALSAAEAAPDVDARAALEARRAEKESPAPTAPVACEAAEVAKRAVGLAEAEAEWASDALGRAIAEHYDELVGALAGGVDDTVDAIAGHLDALVPLFEQLARDTTYLHAVRSGDRRWKHGRPPEWASLAELRAAAEDRRDKSMPLKAKILAAVDAGVAEWNPVAEGIGVHPLDKAARSIRDLLVEDGTLAWVTSEGRPVTRGGIGKTAKPLLVRRTAA